ncbi:MAG: hypothetical protein GX594_08340 [Pirellulaceae bacterium]|nr:hypothetical protein [Pirellulaceae bacterium]
MDVAKSKKNIVVYLRAFVRGTASAAFVVVALAVMAYIKSFGGHWSSIRITMSATISYASMAAWFSLAISAVPYLLAPNDKYPRPICWYNWLNVVTILLASFVPII